MFETSIPNLCLTRRRIIAANRRLIALYEANIRTALAAVWGA